MKSSIAYLNLHQIISERIGQLNFVPSDFNSALFVSVARNSGKNISHITMEFAHFVRAKFFCCLTFDGTGDTGCGISSFAMPKMKLNQHQKALAVLTMLEYLISEKYISAPFDFFIEQVSHDLDGGVSDLAGSYARLKGFSEACISTRKETEAA
jgi:hypothetical protein